MSTFLVQNLNRLLLGKNPLFPENADCVFPDYSGYSIANIPASICEWLGVPPAGQKPLVLPRSFAARKRYKNVILLLVDALGLDALLAESNSPVWGNLISEDNLVALSSVVPSTTTSALVSLWTGCTPLEHAITGYEMYLKEYGLIANMITFAPSAFSGEINSLRKGGLQPETFLGVPPISQHLRYNNAEVHAFQPAQISRSSLTVMLTPGASVHPYRSQSDLWLSLQQLINQPSSHPRYIWAYLGEYDDLAHQYGTADPRLKMEMEYLGMHIQKFIKEIPARLREETLFLLCADHGMIDTLPDPWFEVRNHASVWNKLIMPPSGENRLAYLYPHYGAKEELFNEIRSAWGDAFAFIPSIQAVQSGLFGSGDPHPAFSDRIGEVMLTATGNAYLWWAQKENTLKGRHGALSRKEMLVPLLNIRI